MKDSAKPRNVAVFVFDEVEVLDFAGPFEVFSITGHPRGEHPFHVYAVAEKPGPVSARNHLSVSPRFSFDDCPPPDILVIPGGYGTRPLLESGPVLDWIRTCAESAELVLSVCSGALLLARAGLLDGLGATTHQSALGELAEISPTTTIEAGRRFVDNGKVIASAGVAAGIDMSFHVVRRLLGEEVAVEAAEYMEYDWRRES
jgi:transcriptional regulator GlxA family with amidase domain